MTDDAFPPPADDSEALSAYLAGDMSDADARAFERRLDAEPALAERLDALAAALVSLGGFDTADVPEGFEARLDARLESESASADPPVEQGAPVDLAAHRGQRDRSRLWLGIGTAAAVVAVGAVMASSVLGGLGGRVATTAGGAGSGLEADSSSEAASGESAPGGPLILDQQVALADEAAVERRYSDAPEAQGLIGVPVDEARRLESRFTKTVQRRSRVLSYGLESAPEMTAGSGAGSAAPPDAAEPDADAGREPVNEEPASGAAPEAATQESAKASAPAPKDPCLAAIRQDAAAPLVPVRVESVRYAGRRAIAYVFVTATPGAAELDRTEVWVVRRDNCATLVFQQY